MGALFHHLHRPEDFWHRRALVEQEYTYSNNNNYYYLLALWAATFNDLLEVRTTPRTDCPTKLEDVPAPTEKEYEFFYNLRLNID